MPETILTTFLRLPLTIRVLCISLLIIITFGCIITFIEPETFPSVFDGIWWAIITTTTVGYGDYVPTTIVGRLTGMVLILTGVGFITTYLVSMATSAVSKQNAFMEGKTIFKGENHLVIIGWNERSKSLIQSFITNGEKQAITLIDRTLTNNPKPEILHFIHGNANLDEVLIMANISTASKVIITADQSMEELQADMNSILSLLAIKGLNPAVPCIIEILTNDQVSNANRAGADEIILTNRLASFVMASSLTSQETMTAFLDLLTHLKKKKLQFIQISSIKEFAHYDFVTLSAYLLAEGKILLGVKRGGQTIFNPTPPFVFEDNDELMIIS